MASPLVSIILPCYNGADFIQSSINSVLNQDYIHWELLVINDGSSDGSKDIILQFQDERIRYFEQSNQGVSAARNLGLSQMHGDYFCFLDADDLLSTTSLTSRLVVYKKNPKADFVDGRVRFINSNNGPISNYYQPKFKGHPLNSLLRLSSDCFFGPSWMIKNDKQKAYSFDEKMTHSEDLYFYISIAKNGFYDYTDEVILHYRKGNNSAMSNLIGLERGYIQLIVNIRENHPDIFSTYTKLKIIKIMFLSHLLNGKDIRNAVGSIYRILIS